MAKKSTEIPKLKPAQKRKVILLSLFYIAVFGAAVAFAGVMATCQTPFCNLCHEMNDDFKAWESSTHSEINCLSCHVEPGWIHLLKDKVMAVKSMYYHFFPYYEKPINGKSHLSEEELTDENCMHCHSLAKVTPSEGILIDHKKHEEKKISCPYCHNRTAHPGMKGYMDRQSMDFCMEECHDGKVVTDDCRACHPPDFDLKPSDHQNEELWRTEHGERAKAAEEKEQCFTCHGDEKYCTTCHAISMPHPVNWDRNHKNWTKYFNICANCHAEGKVFCENCHHPGYDPRVVTFRRAHPNVVKQQGETGCGKCHPIKFCNGCHRRQ